MRSLRRGFGGLRGSVGGWSEVGRGGIVEYSCAKFPCFVFFVKFWKQRWRGLCVGSS